MIPTVLTALGLLAFYIALIHKNALAQKMATKEPAAGRPAAAADPAPSTKYADAFSAAVQAAGGLQNLPFKAVYTQSHLETGGGTSNVLKTYNNGFGIHSDGAPNQFWDGQSYLTESGENMRVYKSLDLSVQDYVRLIQRKYPRAIAAAELGDVKGYFQGLVDGGYAADQRYYVNLLSRYKEIYGVDA